MRHNLPRLAAVLLATAIVSATPARAEFLDPDWSDFAIEGIAAPDWVAGENDGRYVGMCTACDGLLLVQVEVLPDDGTGGRVASGETTAATYTDLGKRNAADLGKPAAYYGTEDIDFASAKGFRTSARGATGDYSISYQLWEDGRQLVVKAMGADRTVVEDLADKAYTAAAPLTFR